jgi:hypothetical protein
MHIVNEYKAQKRTRTAGNALIQATVARVIKRRISAGRLDRLLDELEPDEETRFIAAMAPYLFTRPQPEKAKDQYEKLDDEALEKLSNIVTNKVNQIYK